MPGNGCHIGSSGGAMQRILSQGSTLCRGSRSPSLPRDTRNEPQQTKAPPPPSWTSALPLPHGEHNRDHCPRNPARSARGREAPALALPRWRGVCQCSGSRPPCASSPGDQSAFSWVVSSGRCPTKMFQLQVWVPGRDPPSWGQWVGRGPARCRALFSHPHNCRS